MSLAEIRGVSLRELYETDDPNFLTVVDLVASDVIEAREEAARDA